MRLWRPREALSGQHEQVLGHACGVALGSAAGGHPIPALLSKHDATPAVMEQIGWSGSWGEELDLHLSLG